MPIFRRRDGERSAPSAPAGATPSPAPTRRRAEAEPDWRSYDSVAAAYVAVQQPRMALPAADLVALAEVTAGGRVLDVGTGTGVVARAAATAAGPDGLAVGVDLSLPMLAEARTQGGGARYAAAVAIDLPFRDGAFGTVLASF